MMKEPKEQPVREEPAKPDNPLPQERPSKEQQDDQPRK